MQLYYLGILSMGRPKFRALVIGLIASLLLCLSMLGTPMLTAASASIETDKDVYRVGDVMTITVRDPNANVNRFFADTIEVIVKSTSDPGGIKVVLTETGPILECLKVVCSCREH